MKGLSKAISIIAKIGRIITMIAIPLVIATMIILGFVINKVEILDNEIKWNGNDTISIIEEENKITLKVNNRVVADTKNQTEMTIIKEVLTNNSKTAVFTYVESACVVLIITLILATIMLKALENLFNNINKGDTPFTLENVGFIKKIAYLLIVITILPTLGGYLFELLLKMDLEVEFELFSLVEILFLFSIAYIFQYGYEIQLDSKGKMYGDENE